MDRQLRWRCGLLQRARGPVQRPDFSPAAPSHWVSAIHPDDVAATWEAWREAAASGRMYHQEHRVLMADGSYRWHLSRAHPQRDEEGVIVKWFGTSTDIDDFKQADETIRRSEALLRSATDNAGVGLVMLDRNRRYVYANRAYSIVLGLGGGDIQGRDQPSF